MSELSQAPEVAAVERTVEGLEGVHPTVRDVLAVLVVGLPERAAAILAADEELDVDLRARLLAAVEAGGTPAEIAERLGDVCRKPHRQLDPDVIECYRTAFYLGDGWERLLGNPLYARFTANKAHQPFDKWVHYFDIYAKTLAPYIGTDARVLEIGVFHGGGLDQLRHLLGERAVLVGADLDPAARDACAGRFEVAVGDQNDPAFLDSIVADYGPFDVIIDDGGHTMLQQITTIERLFPTLNDGGVYIVEDTHTSYWEEYHDADQTFIEWVKDRLDDIHAYHFSEEPDLPVWTTQVAGLHVYDSVVVLDKAKRNPPFCEVAGTGSFARVDRVSELSLLVYRAALGTALQLREGAEGERHRASEELHRTSEELTLAAEELALAAKEIQAQRRELDEIAGSTSWRMTAPLRKLKRRWGDRG